MVTCRRICRIRVLAENLPVLANSSTRQNGHLGKLVGLDTFADINHPYLPGLDTFGRHSPTIFPGLDAFAKGKFGDFYMNLANLASLANFTSVD
jgi:hypothetical protein